MNLEQNRSEIPIIILSIAAVLAAGVLSMATISTHKNEKAVVRSSDPYLLADQAAKAGFETARWHIENHGRTRQGSLSSHFDINGALYAVEWDNVDLSDSTVNVRSTGEVVLENGQACEVSLESKMKIAFIPERTNTILDSYYSKNRTSALASHQ